jgi:hypothetical protein
MPERKLPPRMEEAERWRQAGRVLRRIDPDAFAALLAAAEDLATADLTDSTDEISKTYLEC